MDCGAATSDPGNDTTMSQVNKRCHCVSGSDWCRTVQGVTLVPRFGVFQGAINGEEDLSEEERARRRAERRKAKRKVRVWTLRAGRFNISKVSPLGTMCETGVCVLCRANEVLVFCSVVGNARSRCKSSSMRMLKG